ncbi:hypothetical protein PENVUL_c037G00574 [Penicillium vulpinum]|uniref:SEC7 domain-containing protein n=1 Tax=Penicillium vulpinum TaxID=29845 RepID=A0A1V6RMP0_9EURO|nr:hypothetical protein PENVUL_c037G00574 [Penicillium vulpinum]
MAINPVALIVTECITVTTALRKHAQWAHSSVSAILGNSPRKPPPTRRDGKIGNVVMLDEDNTVSSRWGLREKKGGIVQDNPLVAAFLRLQSNLSNCKDITKYDTPALLHPFLQVIRSSSTSAAITSLALIAITKFLSYKIISGDSARLAEAMQLLSSALTHCRFEASDSATDEIVLLQVLNLMESIILSPGGESLCNESVSEMMQTGLSMCCQPRLSELLRQSAEIAMVSICQLVFERWKHLEEEVGEELGALDQDVRADMGTMKLLDSKMQTSLTGPNSKNLKSEEKTRSFASVEKLINESTGMTLQKGDATIDLPSMHDEQDEGEALPIKPYSLTLIRELLVILINILDPEDKKQTDTMRITALRILHVVLEVAGPSIVNHTSLATLTKDTLCRYLLQLVRLDNMKIISELLCVCVTLFATCRGVLKLQQELFLSYVVTCVFPTMDIPLEPGIDPSLYEGVPQSFSLLKQSKSQSPAQKSTSGKSTPKSAKDRQKLGPEDSIRTPDAREAILESVSALVRIPSFMVELFVNYDCDIDRSDLCSDLVGLLSRNAFPDSAQGSTTNLPPLCLDSLLSYVQSIADRLDDAPLIEGFRDPNALRQQRSRKSMIMKGASKFNENPKAGIAFLVAQGVIQEPENPKNIAEFIKGTTRIDKKILGEFISKKTNENILNEFMKLFNFAGKRIDEAIRELLGAFRLPGESALIERIVEVFAAQYMDDAKPAGIADSTAAFVLVYATILLNTDQHNPNFRGQKRMTIENFAQNLRGVNDQGDFDSNFLQEIFDSIRTHEIILPEEHDDKHAYDYAWNELLIKAESTSDLVSCNTNIFDADMFAATWKPIVGTLSYMFISATDDAVLSKIVTGFGQCGQIAAKYRLSDALDRIVACLSHISTLAPEVTPSTSLKIEVQHEKLSVMISETAVRFGRDDRAQLATVVLFRILNGNEGAIRDGWEQILRILLNLFINSLIPSSFSSARKSLELPSIPLQSPTQIINKDDRAADTSLFYAFASYVSSFANGEPPEPSDEEIENTLCTIDTISACSLDEITSNIFDMSTEALRPLFMALLSRLPEDTSLHGIAVKPDIRPSVPIEQSHSEIIVPTTAYDPSLAFILDLLTNLTLRDRKTTELFGRETVGALKNFIHDANQVHPVLVSRAVYHLLQFVGSSNDYDFIKTPIILHALSSFDADHLQQCARPLLQGLAACIGGPQPLRNEIATSPDFWSILHQLLVIPETAAGVFQLAEDLASTVHTSISMKNYEAIVQLLNKFATAASVGAVPERRITQGRRTKYEDQPPPKKAEPDEMVQRGVKATNIIYNLTVRVPQLIAQSQLSTPEAWNAYWSPIFRVLIAQCLNPCREVSTQALELLKDTLLSKNTLFSGDHTEWIKIFSQVLFPLVTQLLKPEVYQPDPEEVVAENMKNILLVMANGGYLVLPEEKPQQAELWDETWKRLEAFLPHLFKELFPGVKMHSEAVHNPI